VSADESTTTHRVFTMHDYWRALARTMSFKI
jgi:hypothetical protein